MKGYNRVSANFDLTGGTGFTAEPANVDLFESSLIGEETYGRGIQIQLSRAPCSHFHIMKLTFLLVGIALQIQHIVPSNTEIEQFGNT